MTKLDPTAQDRWWRNRIEKEEAAYVDKTKKASKSKIVLSALGTPQQVPASAAVSHMLGAGALVRVAKAVGLESLSDASGPSASGRSRAGGSVANSKIMKLKADMDARSSASGGRPGGSSASAGGRAHSNVSYPKTPNFSAAGTHKTSDTEIMNRLARLENELMVEKVRREAAEREMKEIMSHVGEGGA